MKEETLEEVKTRQANTTIYKIRNNIFRVEREFATSGHSMKEQIITMLMDEMEKRKEKQSNGNARE